MKKFFKRQGKKLTAVATAFALLCTAGVIPEDVLQVSAAETETGGMEEQVPEEELVIDENFPDENFGNYLRKEADTDENGALSKEEVQSFREVRLNGQENDTPDNEKIESLKGIEKLTALTRVDVSYNKLSGELDLSNWSKLDSFSCMGNEITSLNLKTQTELKYLACADNLIETLDLSGQTGLTQLTCGDTLLKTIDLSGQTGSVYFDCSRNCLTSILFPKAQNQEEEIAYQRSMNYLQQKKIDFKDEKIFPNFDTGRLRGIYVTGAGEEEDKSKDCLDTVKEKDYVLTDLQAGDKVCYTYNCAAEGAESEILLDFAITIGYPEGTMPPRYPNTDAAYDVPFTTQYLKEVPLPEDWKWSDEYDGNEELNDGNSSFYWAEYTGSDKEYYEECYQTASVGFYRDRCDHPQDKMILYKAATASAITENLTYAKCEECNEYFLNPKENREYSSVEEADISVVPVVDCTERAEIHVNYGTALKDLDLIHLKKAGYLSGQESPVSVNKLLVQNVWYKKDEDSEQVDYYGRVDFTTSLDGVVELTGEEKSLGSISCDRILEPGEYTLDLVMKVGEQNVHVLRTIFVDKIDLSKYSDYNLKILVNGKELSDEPISCNYTKKEVKPTVRIVDGETNEPLIWNYHFIYDYANNVELAEADQDNAPTIIVQGMGNYTGELRIPFTIKRQRQPDIPDSILYTSYASKAVGEVELSGGWKWASGDSEKALPDVGEGLKVTAEYTGDDWELYETTMQEVTIIRQACVHPQDMLEYRDAVENSTCGNGYSGDAYCTQCGKLVEEGETIYAPHELEFVEGKPATDTTSGNYPYYVCHKCGKYFEDADAEWETTLEEVTIPVRATSAPSVTPIPTQTVEETETPGQTPDPVQETATVAPTTVPSGNPSVSTAPVAGPTKEPSASTAPVADPTKEPSASTAPVADPTKEPLVTVAPTGIPGQIPATEVPTEKPSETPVAEPTDAPDPLPSDPAMPGQSMTPVPEISQAPAVTVPLPSAAPKQTPSASPAGQSKKPARVGKIIKDSQGNRYKVTSSNRRKPTVKFYSPGAKVKKVVISERVRIDGINYYVTALGSRAFERNRKVTSVRLGGKVNTIGDRAFRNCRKLRELYIQCTKLKPGDIGNRVFDGVCSGVRVSVPRSKLEEYRKMLQDKGLKKTVPVTYGKIK